MQKMYDIKASVLYFSKVLCVQGNRQPDYFQICINYKPIWQNMSKCKAKV